MPGSVMAALMIPLLYARRKKYESEQKYTVSEVSSINKGGAEIHMSE